jgi:alpha-L-rhamnosidase
VSPGATTIWERWDGVRPDGSFEDPSMNSFNHYAYGAIGDWMYRVVAGLDMDPAQPAYRHALIHPQPGGGLTRARATLETPYGELGSSWTIDGGALALSVRVPPNTTATVRLPHASLAAVTEGDAPLDATMQARQDGDAVVVSVGSGDYRFRYPWGVTRVSRR